MKIEATRVCQIGLPLKEGRYTWADGKYVEVFDSTAVEIASDDGRTGIGAVCPHGSFRLPAFAVGARTGLEKQRQGGAPLSR